MAAQQAPAFEKGKLYDLPIIDIKPDPDQPVSMLSQELTDRLNEIISRLQPRQLA